MLRQLGVVVAGALLAPLIGGCGSNERRDQADAVPAKICGLLDRDRVVELGIVRDDIRARGEVFEKAEREDEPLRCEVSDRGTGKLVARIDVEEVAAADADGVAGALTHEYLDKKSKPPRATVCSRPEVLKSLGTGYACRTATEITVAVALPGRLVRLEYFPILHEPHAAAYARAIGLIGNLQENLVAYDQLHASPTPTPTSSGSPSGSS